MKATAKDKREWIERRRKAHHAALETLKGPDCNLTGLQIWRKLRPLERLSRDAATKLCNAEIEQEQFDAVKQRVKEQVSYIFGCKPKGFFLNSDPRGCALKIESEDRPEGMERDWGGYGILAAEIE